MNQEKDTCTQVVIKTYLGEIVSQKYNPVPPGFVGKKCFFCDSNINKEDAGCTIPTRPANLNEYNKMHDGKDFSCLVEPAHWNCLIEFATGIKP